MSTAQADIVIVGGGITGLVFAQLLATTTAHTLHTPSIRLLESSPPQPPAADESLDLRVSAIAPATREILQAAGIWERLPDYAVSSYEAMQVWEASGKAGGPRSISFTASELGEPVLGYIVENRALRVAAWTALQDQSSVELISNQRLVEIQENAAGVTLTSEQGDDLQARLLVGADGANSWVRQQLGVAFNEQPYAQSAIVAHLETELPNQATAWQRFIVGGPVAMLPLSDGRSSLVWSCPTARAAELLALSDDDFAAQLQLALDNQLGQIKCTTQRVSFPLVKGSAAAYTGRRFALLGDAAHRVHPLAGQGANIGLLDAAVLAEELGAHMQLRAADPGDPLVLRRYERRRKGDNLATQTVLDALHHVFASPYAAAAGRGMELVDAVQPLKSRLARYAIGQGRDLPAVARGRQSV